MTTPVFCYTSSLNMNVMIAIITLFLRYTIIPLFLDTTALLGSQGIRVRMRRIWGPFTPVAENKSGTFHHSH